MCVCANPKPFSTHYFFKGVCCFLRRRQQPTKSGVTEASNQILERTAVLIPSAATPSTRRQHPRIGPLLSVSAGFASATTVHHVVKRLFQYSYFHEEALEQLNRWPSMPVAGQRDFGNSGVLFLLVLSNHNATRHEMKEKSKRSLVS